MNFTTESATEGIQGTPTGNNSDLEEEDDYPEQNARATYTKAKFACIPPTIQKKTSRMDVEPRPTRTRAGQVITRTHWHQQLINVAIDSLQEDDYSGLPDLETDDHEQGSGNVAPQFEIQDDSMIESIHNINIMFFPDEIIWTDKQTGQIVPLRNVVRSPIEPTVTQNRKSPKKLQVFFGRAGAKMMFNKSKSILSRKLKVEQQAYTTGFQAADSGHFPESQ